MRFRRQKSRVRRYSEGILADAVSYITGFSPVPIPMGVLEMVWKDFRHRFPRDYVDWELEDWPQRYGRVQSKCARIIYQAEQSLLPQVMIHDNTLVQRDISNYTLRLLPGAQVHCVPDWAVKLTVAPFAKLDARLRQRSKTRQRSSGNATYWNGKNLRLAGIDGTELSVQIVGYHDYVHTNLLLDADCGGGRTLRDEISKRITSVRDGDLEPLDQSPLANNLGINILLFTADGLLVMQKRSGGVAFRGGEYCPAASGTADVADVDRRVFGDLVGKGESVRETLRFLGTQALKSSMSVRETEIASPLNEARTIREMSEEISVIAGELSELQFLGITRELVRGGEPEMFFFALSKLGKDEVRERWNLAPDKWETEKLVFFDFGHTACHALDNKLKEAQFLKKCDEFIFQTVQKRNRAGITLLTNIALWQKYKLGLEWD